jgi:PAS domain-containing protein
MQRMILDAIPAHLAMLDLNGKVVFINESWQRFIGFPVEASSSVEVGQNYIEYCELADHTFGGAGFKLAEGIRNVLKDGAHPYTLTHPMHKEGTIKWYRVTATSLGRTDLIDAVLMYQDVTEQHLAEEQIHQQAMLLDQAEDAILSRTCKAGSSIGTAARQGSMVGKQ